MRHILWALLLGCGLVAAQQYPNRPVKLINFSGSVPPKT
jgi:hypothetical protein